MGSPSDPVTTDPKGEIADVIRKMADKNRAAIIRRPLNLKLTELGPYISGYVDGEGCFTVSTSRRQKMTTGWEVRPSFSVSQNQDRAKVLYLIADYFQCGTIRPDRSDKTLKYEVRSLKDLVDRIIPHFEKYPLLSEKQAAFQAFRSICLEMIDLKHLDSIALQSILQRAGKINSGKRKYRFGEDIV